MFPISRRQLFGVLTGFLAPDLRISIPGYDERSGSEHLTCSAEDDNFKNQSALEAWKRLPMLPLIDFRDFSSVAHADRELLLGRIILGHIASQTDFEFRYLSGSEPGNTRRAIPILLFRKFEMPDQAQAINDDPHVYLLAFCHTRQQARTFRLDKIADLS